MKFTDVVEINPRISLKKGINYPFVEMANVSTNSREPSLVIEEPFSSGVKFEKNDSVIARIEPCLQNGKRFFCKYIEQGFGSTEYLVFRTKDKKQLDNTFLWYFLYSDHITKSMINSMSGATGRQRVNNDIFKSLDITLPPLPTQQKIASILSAYDDLIENNRKQIKLLEEAAQKLYKEWFVKLNFPGHENTKIVDGIPEEWKKEKVGNLISTLSKTKQIKTSEIKKTGKIPVIDQSRDFIAGYTDDLESLISPKKPVIVFGDHTRILKLIQFPFARGADGTQTFISINENIQEYQLYCALIEIDLSSYSYARHFKYLKEELVFVPTKEISNRFESFATSSYKMIQKLRDQIQLLQSARDKLLPKLMNGEIEV